MKDDGMVLSFRGQIAPAVWLYPKFQLACLRAAAHLQLHVQLITLRFYWRQGVKSQEMGVEFAWRNGLFARAYPHLHMRSDVPGDDEIRIAGVGTPSYEEKSLPVSRIDKIEEYLGYLISYRARAVREDLVREANRLWGDLLNLDHGKGVEPRS